MSGKRCKDAEFSLAFGWLAFPGKHPILSFTSCGTYLWRQIFCCLLFRSLTHTPTSLSLSCFSPLAPPLYIHTQLTQSWSRWSWFTVCRLHDMSQVVFTRHLIWIQTKASEYSYVGTITPILQMWKAELRKAYMVPKFMQGRGGGSEFNSSLLISVSLCFLDFR